MPSQAWEHLQTVVMQVHNRHVREEFDDLADDDDISTPRSSLRTACKMLDSDTAEMTLVRYFLFYFDIRKAKDLQGDYYGIPITSFQEIRKFKPQIRLYFQEDFNDVEPGYAPVTGEITFRLMDSSIETLTESQAERLANKVKTAFGSGNRFVWKKGKIMCSYTDRERGYQLQLLCRSKAEGRRLIEQVLDIQNDTPDWKFLNVSENEEPTASFPTIPPHKTIIGKSRRLPRARPMADVRFQHAVLHLWGLPNPIVLVDYSRTYHHPLVSA